MTDLAASSSSSSSAAPVTQLPWSFASPPSAIELWHVARGAAAARTAAAAAAASDEEEEEAGETFDLSRCCSASLHEEEDQNRWSLDEWGSLSHEDEGDEGKAEERDDEEEEDQGRVRSSPTAARRTRRNRRSRSCSRPHPPFVALDEDSGSKWSPDHLEDLIGSMLVRKLGVKNKQGKLFLQKVESNPSVCLKNTFIFTSFSTITGHRAARY